jgi:hypothetical protein
LTRRPAPLESSVALMRAGLAGVRDHGQETDMSQPDQNAAQVLFTGPTFHVSGVQIVAEAGEVSLYFTSTRHAFSANATQVRTVNEVVARVIATPPGAARIRDLLKAYLEQQGQGKL